MSIAEVDRYLQAVDPPRRAALEELRRTILDVVPTAEQVISYNVPASSHFTVERPSPKKLGERPIAVRQSGTA